LQFLQFNYCNVEEKGGIPDTKPYSLPWFKKKIHTETSNLRALKIMPRNCTFMNSASGRILGNLKYRKICGNHGKNTLYTENVSP
jgi:hypothetical protein